MRLGKVCKNWVLYHIIHRFPSLSLIFIGLMVIAGCQGFVVGIELQERALNRGIRVSML